MHGNSIKKNKKRIIYLLFRDKILDKTLAKYKYLFYNKMKFNKKMEHYG